jgi:hypothetical protein
MIKASLETVGSLDFTIFACLILARIYQNEILLTTALFLFLSGTSFSFCFKIPVNFLFSFTHARVLSPGKPYSVQITQDSLDKTQMLRFELRKDEQWIDITKESSFRSEIDVRDKPAMKSEKWYRFILMLPDNFPIEDNRLVLAQWHGRDKWWLGEKNRSPVLALRFRNGIFRITLLHSNERIVKEVDNVPSENLYKTKEFPLSKWNVFVVNVKWSYKNDGFVNIWWNNLQIVKYSGSVGNNDNAGPYFQFGIYRDSTSQTYISYMKDIELGDCATDIHFKIDPPEPVG